MRKIVALSAVTLALVAFAAAPALAGTGCSSYTAQTAHGDGVGTTQTAEHPQTPKPAETRQ